MALPLPERWRAPVGVMAAMPRRGKTQGFAMLGTARDLPDATLISRVYLQRGLTPAVSRAARSEASGGHQPGTGWRRLDHPVRLQWMPAPWRDTTTWLSWVFAAVPKLSDGVTTSRAMACAGGRDGSHAQARQNTRLCHAWNCQRFA